MSSFCVTLSAAKGLDRAGAFCNTFSVLDSSPRCPDSSPAKKRRDQNDNDVAVLLRMTAQSIFEIASNHCSSNSVQAARIENNKNTAHDHGKRSNDRVEQSECGKSNANNIIDECPEKIPLDNLVCFLSQPQQPRNFCELGSNNRDVGIFFRQVRSRTEGNAGASLIPSPTIKTFLPDA